MNADLEIQDHKTPTLWLTGALHAFTHLYQVALMPLYLLMQRDFHFQNVGRVTLLMTVMLVATFGPSYAVGVLADKLNRKRLLGFGLALNGAGFAALALAPSFAWALAAAAVAGLGGSFYHPAATAMIARLFPSATGKALGFVGIGAGAGFFVGPIYSGWRAAHLEPILGPAAWRRPVLELGLAGILAAALFAWWAQPERASPSRSTSAAPHARMFPTPALWGLFLGYCFAFSLRDFAGASMGSLGSLFLQEAHGYDPKLTGMALSGIFVVATVSNPLFGSLSDRGRKRWTTLALVVAAAVVALFPHVPRAWIIPALATYGFFFMGAYPMTEAALMDAVPDSVRGRVFGVFVMTGGVIGNMSHWAVGALVKRMGAASASVEAYYPFYAALAGLLLLSLTGLLCLRGLQKREGKLVHATNCASLP
jgi:MFS transporter, FSR family, fosmidomycin resistance protein